MDYNYFEFGVTKTIDWCDVETVFVKCISSGEAIRHMLKLTSPVKTDREFVDFKFRTALPECRLPFNPVIISVS